MKKVTLKDHCGYDGCHNFYKEGTTFPQTFLVQDEDVSEVDCEIRAGAIPFLHQDTLNAYGEDFYWCFTWGMTVEDVHAELTLEYDCLSSHQHSTEKQKKQFSATELLAVQMLTGSFLDAFAENFNIKRDLEKPRLFSVRDLDNIDEITTIKALTEPESDYNLRERVLKAMLEG